MSFPENTPDIIQIKVSPGSRKTEYTSTLLDGTLKIRLKAPPTDGQANRALFTFLKKETDTDWEIMSGQRSSRKFLRKKL